jgi:hypothetical protein
MVREGILQIILTNKSIPYTKIIPRFYNHRYCEHENKSFLEYFTLII